jgi:adenosylmethionine-8-amino-7-oxononanoate aminotransferase
MARIATDSLAQSRFTGHDGDMRPLDHDHLQQAARDHLWMHFTRHSTYDHAEVPVIVRGEGAYIFDDKGKRYLDGLAGLFVSQLGHGRADLAEAAAAQARELAFMPLWSYAHPPAVELAERIAGYAPGDLNRVFFTSGGGEAVETAWKLAKNYFKLVGKPMKHKVLSRSIAYHGTTQGALSITGLPLLKQQFEPLVPSTFRVPNTNVYRASEHGAPEGLSPEAFGRWAADQIAIAIENEGPDTVAAVFLEPVQNAGGCFPPPPGYFQRVREICDEYDVLLVSDEVICAFGRLGHMFGAERYGYQPDMITCAKGITSGYAPLGAMIASDRLMEPFLGPGARLENEHIPPGARAEHGSGAMFAHGYTFGGHPVSTAVALANLDIFENEDVLGHVRANEAAFRATLEKLTDLPIVGDVRGDGYFYGIELVKDKATKETFTDEECERLLYGFVSKQLYAEGLYCRADDRGDPVVQLAPPLICDQSHFDEMEQILRAVLDKAGSLL